MSFVAAATTVGATVLGTGAAAGIGSTIVGGALIGAGVGGAYSALTGDGNVLDSMLTGAGIGGLAGGVGGAMFPGAAGYAPASGVATGAAANTPSTFAYNSAGEMVPANYDAAITGATNMPGPSNPSWWGSLSGGEKLATGLGATTLMGLLGGQPEGVSAPSDKGMIRPYEYSTAKREPEEGKSYYFEPIQYDQYGKTTKPLDTSERNYFTQKFTPLPTYKAALGGQVPKLDNMPNGGLAAIQSMRDGYGANQTMDGNIPQFALGGILSKFTGQAKADEGLPKYSFDPETRKYTRLNGLDEQNKNANFDGDISKMFRSLNGGMGDMIRNVVGQFGNPQQQTSNKFSYDPSSQRYENLANGGQVPNNKMLEQMQQMKFERDISKRFNMGGMAEGDLGGYSDGGRLLRGPGDGVSDDIPATINDRQPARLADGEFVIPARIVSEIGNGSTDAGAKRLYDMMDKIQAGRKKTVGKGKIAVDTKAKKHLLA